MKINAGLWIDHREAIIVLMSETGDITKRIQSGVEKHPGPSGDPVNNRSKTHEAAADDSRDNEYAGHLARYYDEIITHVRDAGSILIFGPGEAKGELKKRFATHKGDTRSILLETSDKMTEPQAVAQVRRHFHADAARRGA